MDASDESLAVTRRTVLGGVAAIPAGFALQSPTAAPTATVMSRNLYLGVDLSRLFDARSMDDVREIAGELLDDIEHHPFAARMDAIAAEIAEADADIVGLQEAALIRTQRPSDFDDGADENAANVLIDLLDLLVGALAERGREYEVAASTVTTDVEFPAETDDGVVDLRHTDRVAVLVRSDIETADARTDTYEENATLPIPDSDRELTLRRGYCLVDVTLDDSGVTAAATHLESVSSIPRRAQAGELVDRLPDDRPVVVLGDVNTGPRTDPRTYERLTASLDDAYAELRPESDGYTCCQAPDLRNSQSRLDKRVDVVLYRGDVRPLSVRHVGDRPADRVDARVAGEKIRVWPSDHAGVVTTVELAPPTPTSTQTATTTPDTSFTATRENGTSTAIRTGTRTQASTGARTEPSTTSEAGPGLGVVSAIAGLAVGALAKLRRDGR